MEIGTFEDSERVRVQTVYTMHVYEEGASEIGFGWIFELGMLKYRWV